MKNLLPIKNQKVSLSSCSVLVFREVALMMGLCNSSKRSLKNCLSEPANGVTTLVVGGAQEALQGTDDTIELILKNRKGFVKLALETGADLIPCFGFGEQQIFQMLQMPEGSKMRRFQEWFKKKTTFSPGENSRLQSANPIIVPKKLKITAIFITLFRAQIIIRKPILGQFYPKYVTIP